MSRFVRLLILGVLCATAGTIVAAAQGRVDSGVVRSASAVASARQPGIVATGGPIGDQLVLADARWLLGDEQLLADERARRANPQARALAFASRTAYERLRSGAVLRLARSAFPAAIWPTPTGPRLLRGQRVTRYLSGNAARLDLGGGRRAIAESNTPIATLTATGGWRATSLRLRGSGSGYSPVNSAVPLVIPRRLSKGVALGDTGVRLLPLDGAGKAPHSSGVLDRGSVVYANTQTDTDTLVKPLPAGFEADDLLRSARSPQALAFRLAIPSGATLNAPHRASGAVSVVKHGRIVAFIPAPTALDAAGTPVPVTIGLSGHRLRLTIKHRAGGYRYPIMVDPAFVDTDTNGSEGPNAGNWKGETNTADFGVLPHWRIYTAHAYVTNDKADVDYETDGESQIYKFVSTTAVEGNTLNGIKNMLEIGKAGTAEATLELANKYPSTQNTLCINSCNPPLNPQHNTALFIQGAVKNGEDFDNAYLTAAEVFVTQEKGPAVSWDTTDENISVWRNALYNGSWGNESSLIELKASDPGLGVSEFQFKWVGHTEAEWGTKQSYLYPHAEGRCFGIQCEPCIGIQCPSTHIDDSISPAKLAEGEDTIEAKIIDPVGLSVTSTHVVKYDNAPPHGITIKGLPAGNEIGEGQYTLKLTATAADGSGSTPSSGIASITMAVDGVQVGSPSAGCSQGPCTAIGEWTLNPETYGAGKHTLSVTATDKAGNVAQEEVSITIHHASPLPVGPGTVNPVTGEFSLESTDVSVPAGSVSLTVSRAFSSHDPTAGEKGPLGKEWSLDMGPQAGIVKEPNGNLTLENPDGSATTFVNKGGGVYTPPNGVTNLTLTEKIVEGATQYVLGSDGTSTTFAIPTGGSGTLWKPVIAEGVGGTNTISYSFTTTAGGITEPSEELAPVPAGVSCAPELKKGCRALTFNYATTTTATSSEPSGWGDYAGNLTRVYFTAWDPSKSEMTTTTVAQYAYDTFGRLRAEWDPRISPALKTVYGYKSEELVAVSPPGQQPWLLIYGENAGDPRPGRLVSVKRPAASTALGEGRQPTMVSMPTVSSTTPTLGKTLTVTNGSWNNTPLAYSYQWLRCLTKASICKRIYGARNKSYTPSAADVGYSLSADVTATNAGGAIMEVAAGGEVVPALAPTASLRFGSVGIGNGQFKQPTNDAIDSAGNVWVTDYMNNRVEKFSATGTFLAAYGTTGTGNGQFNGPWGIAIDPSGNVYVADSSNCRVQELSSSGAFIRAFGSCGANMEQLGLVCGLAFAPDGNLWVADEGRDRLVEFSPTGAYLRTFGSEGSGNGQFNTPRDIAFAGGNMYVTDQGNNRVQEFSPAGAYMTQFGSAGTAGGQFSGPVGIALDPQSGDLFVADLGNSRVEQFTPAGKYLTSFGSEGSGASQLLGALGVAINSEGAIYVLDNGNGRVSEWLPTPALAPKLSFGSLGSGNGQLSRPVGGALDAAGDVWVADAGNNRVEEFSPTGGFMTAFGSYGTGNGQFNSPDFVAVNKKTGTIYVSDDGNSRVEEFSPAGSYLGTIGSYGTEPGQFNHPGGIAFDSSDNLWVTDVLNNRVEEFSSSGTYLQQFGSKGSGNGQLNEPAFIAMVSGTLYITDWANNRVEEFDTSGKYLAQFGSTGTGNGQLKGPDGLAADPDGGDIYVADSGNHRIEAFTPTGAFAGAWGSSGSGEAQFGLPVGLVMNESGSVYVVDNNNNRIADWTSQYHGSGPALPPEASTTATWTLAYGVPISGSGAPYPMGSAEVGKWAQTDLPAEAMAIFPPDEPQSSPPSDYRRATIDYLDSADRPVNVVSPGGATSTSEYNSYNDVVRTLSPADRELALKEGAKSAEASQQLDTQSAYASEGTELTSTLGPLHTVKLANGSEAQARAHTQYYYDEGAPEEGGPYRLVTKVTTGAQIAEKPEEDVRTTVTSYGGQEGLGWLLRQPTSVTTDPSGLKLVHTTLYDRTTGQATETRSPGAGPASEESPVAYAYQSAFTGSLSSPGSLARDSEGHIWVADTLNSHVKEFSAAGALLQEWGFKGSAYGQLEKPEGIAVDRVGDVWVADTGNNRVEEFNSGGGLLNVITQTNYSFLKAPAGVAIDSESHVYVLDKGNNCIDEFTSGGNEIRIFGSFFNPEGIALDGSGNVWVADTGHNRIAEYTKEGVFLQKFGSSGAGNGQLSKPEGLAVDSAGNVLVADGGNNRVEEFGPHGGYEYQFGTAGTGNGQFKTPADLVLDSSNNAFVLDTGNNRVEKWTWSEHSRVENGGTYGTQTIYYSVAANSKYPGCGGHPEWASLPCQTQPAKQPETAGIPNLPVTTTTYNLWQEPLTSTSTVGTATRTSTSTYDGAGRPLTTEISSSVGTSLPAVKDEYSSETGLPMKISTTVEGKTRTLTSTMNSLDQLVSYTDADENTTTYSYDIDGRTEQVSDGKGTQAFAYDATTGAAASMTDTAAGTFTAAYSPAGRLSSVGYPNGMSANYTYNSAGETTKLEYVKTTHCSSGCTWYTDSVVPSIAGQWLAQTSSLSSQSYTYDNAGRLTKTQDTPAGQGCTTRIYAYDVETNRTSLTTRNPGEGGACATTGGTTETHSFDTANRLSDSGVGYDSFGNTTKLPAAAAGGSEVTSTFYVNNALATQTQGGETVGYYLDPSGRAREVVSTGNTNSTVTLHYSGTSDSPIWTATATGKWTRNISGLEGGLVAVQNEGESPVLQLVNLHGDIVATASTSETAEALLSSSDTTEYGVPRTSSPPKYSWLGGDERSTELPSGIIAMGARSYVPQVGRFLQTDPVPGGSANAYAYTYGDPVNTADPSGEHIWDGGPGEAATISTEAVAEMIAAEAAREMAARIEAELKAQGDGVDPHVYFTAYEAMQRVKKLRELGIMGEIATTVGDIGAAPIELIEGIILDKFGMDKVKKWFEETEELLERCASDDILKMGKRAIRNMRCRYEWHTFKILGVTIVNFWWKPRVALCVHKEKYCTRLQG